MLSICWYVTEEVAVESDLILTLIVDVSINELSRINFWLNKEVSTVKLCVMKAPSYISILLNYATPFVTGTVISSGMQNM